jgi:hypothetical protein
MIIKFIPETKEEKEDFENRGIDDVTHYGVKEYMIFGNKMDDDGEIEDFHEWHGAYKFLLGSLKYFYEVINDNRRGQNNNALRVAQNKIHKNKVAPNISPMIKRGEIAPNITPLNVDYYAGQEKNEDDNASINEPALNGLHVVQD